MDNIVETNLIVFETKLKQMKKEGELNMLLNDKERFVISKLYESKLNDLREELYSGLDRIYDFKIDYHIKQFKWLNFKIDLKSKCYKDCANNFIYDFKQILIVLNENNPQDFRIIQLY